MATSQPSAALITIAALGTTLLIGTGCSYSPDAGLGPVPVQDAWAGCIDIADGQGTELSTIVDAPTDTPTRLPGHAESAAWYRNDEYVSLGDGATLDSDGCAGWTRTASPREVGRWSAWVSREVCHFRPRVPTRSRQRCSGFHYGRDACFSPTRGATMTGLATGKARLRRQL